MPGWKTMLKVAGVTMAVMLGMNYLASMNSTARKIIKKSVVSPVGNSNNSSTTISV